MDNNKSFFSSGVYGCVHYPRIKCSGNSVKKKDDYISKIQIYNFFSKNEYKIGKIVETLNEPSFVTVEKKCYIKEKQLKNISQKHSCKILKNKKKHNKYIILYSKYINAIQYKVLLENQFSIKNIFKLYLFLLNSITLLITKNIIHKDLHFANIILNKDTKDINLIDFGLSIHTDLFYEGNQLNYTFLKKIFIDFDPSWHYWSIENHILCFYLYKNKQLDEKMLKKIIKGFLNKNIVFNHFHSIDQLSNKMFLFLKEKYINDVPIEDKIKDILDHSWKTWDLYQISYILLSIFIIEKINNFNSFKNMLIQSLHYDYEKRPNIEVLISDFYTILENYDKSTLITKIKNKLNHKTIMACSKTKK